MLTYLVLSPSRAVDIQSSYIDVDGEYSSAVNILVMLLNRLLQNFRMFPQLPSSRWEARHTNSYSKPFVLSKCVFEEKMG